MGKRTYRPFHCGSQAGDWMASNCESGCSRYRDEGPSDCPILNALNEAWWGDGAVSEEIARRMGLPGNELALVWPCPEHDPPFADAPMPAAERATRERMAAAERDGVRSSWAEE